jgi:hypothetical protein
MLLNMNESLDRMAKRRNYYIFRAESSGAALWGTYKMCI